ncbi:M24 family metallopeptidase [Deinococcus sp. SL84]|uniref:M24 family metallopeptidase n=1 Tax=Deinococcus sp. SL84 TaxID=2994663 RepID=UPI0022762D36|nr:Xaa-Pro peptidase family protein [Deinococcus sp. SL84]MCY1702244.1 Xaa-Pro peptidase family protein [Deinococcus sp. SL84]
MEKIEQLRAALARRGLQALWVSDPANVRYLSGFTHPDDGRLLVTPGAAVLYTDGRYTVQAQEDALPGIEVVIARPLEAIEGAAPAVAGMKMGVEGAHLTVSALERLKERWQVQFHPVEGLVEELRLHKSADEVAGIRAAQALADRVFAEVRPQIRAGVRELDIAMALEQGLRQAGATSAFDVIVASGVRGALPHGTASDRVIEDGDLVTVDFGANLNGYNSDMTRTVAVGQPADELKRLYNAVLEAEEAAVRAVRPGLKASDLDAVARDILAGHGLAEAFAHSLGHGVGLVVHEGPRLAQGSEDVLAPGMVITIEPGAYVPGLGGVRIEDLVLVTEDGYEVLSHSPRETLA